MADIYSQVWGQKLDPDKVLFCGVEGPSAMVPIPPGRCGWRNG